MKVVEIKSLEQWGNWQHPWQELTAHNPMLSFEWLQAWWKHYGLGHQLHILAVVDNQKLLGLLPLYEHASPLGIQFRYLGTGKICGDYLTAAVDPANAAEVYETFIENFREAFATREFLRKYRGFSLDGVVSDDAWLTEFREVARHSRFTTQTQSVTNAWKVELRPTWEQHLAHLPSKGAVRKAKKARSRLDRGELRVRVIDSRADMDEGMKIFSELHSARRGSIGDGGCFLDPRFAPFMQQAIGNLMQRGAARFTVCESGGTAIGVQLQLLGSTDIQMYQSGYQPDAMQLEPGHALIVHALQDGIERGYLAYDFLRGDEPYKAFWGAKPTPLVREILTAPSLKAQAIAMIHQNLSWLKSCSQNAFAQP